MTGTASGSAVEMVDVSITFRERRGRRRPQGGVQALRNVSLSIAKGETLGVVGESGSGKSTLSRVLVGLAQPTAGRVLIDGADLWAGPKPEFRRTQMVFQDASSSLDPRMLIGRSVAEPVRDLGKIETRRKVEQALEVVGISPEAVSRFPHEFSGGQQQRIAIARALIADPTFVAFDEPTSALDVSLQAQILRLIQTVSEHVGFASLFVSHDLAAVEAISDRVAVMYLGMVVEVGPFSLVSSNPLHPYTVGLREAVPIPDPAIARGRAALPVIGEIPDAANPPSGCPFRTRCPIAVSLCTSTVPELVAQAPGHLVACHRPGEFEYPHRDANVSALAGNSPEDPTCDG